MKSLFKNNKLKISAPAWIDKLKLFDGLYSVSHIQDHFGYIKKK